MFEPLRYTSQVVRGVIYRIEYRIDQNTLLMAKILQEPIMGDGQAPPRVLESERVHSPLVIDDEAHIINNDGLSVEETINKILALINQLLMTHNH